MNKPEQLRKDQQLSRPVFVSYATADRKEALALCKSLERRGTKCWISTRDVEPGENYQEAIVAAIQHARAMVLVFSEAANNSNEIKKELSLASRFNLTVIAVRIEDVQPSNAFAYELSTRQWIDAFESWDKSIDALTDRLQQVGPSDGDAPPAPPSSTRVARRRASIFRRRTVAIACSVLVVLAVTAAAWLFLRPSNAAAHSMMVRLTGFSRLSPDMPVGTPDAMRDEIIAAFNDDGVVGVSTASAPPAGSAPAYALGGTIRRDGNSIKVNVRLSNERSGATLWSNMYTYDANQLARVPRWIAVGAGNIVRCGLFAASTYPKTLPDAVLSDYMNFCYSAAEQDPDKALLSARRVVTAAPDFSWGWSAVAVSAINSIGGEPSAARAKLLREQATQAADKAIALDRGNSAAYTYKAELLPPGDFVGQEKLFKQALAARPLECGCEHHNYGLMLESVGRQNDAIEEFRRSTEVLALNANSQQALADMLLAVGRTEEAKPHADAAIDLNPDAAASVDLAVVEAPIKGDYPAEVKALEDPGADVYPPLKVASLAAYRAILSGDGVGKARAVQMLMALPPYMKARFATVALGALGANREALQVVVAASARGRFDATTWLFLPPMRGALDDPSFPAIAQRLGLMRYWKASHIKPDVCSTKDPPPFCRMI